MQTPYYRQVIKFSYEEVEALLQLFPDDKLTPHEISAKEKLKKIYARQILSFERKGRKYAANE